MMPMTQIESGFTRLNDFQHFPARTFPTVQPPPPYDWLTSHFAVGGWSPLKRLSGMLTAHMTNIAPHSGFSWHPHRGLEIYTWVLEGALYHEDTTGGKGVIRAGEFQRMFAGDYIEHQELNRGDVDARVIQIWYMAGREHRGLEPHYQQVTGGELPTRQVGDGTVYQLIADGSPMEHHVDARLTATTVTPGGITTIEGPRADEDLFVYVTDGDGRASSPAADVTLGQYDVMLLTPRADEVTVQAGGDAPLTYMSYYLPRFLL